MDLLKYDLQLKFTRKLIYYLHIQSYSDNIVKNFVNLFVKTIWDWKVIVFHGKQFMYILTL